MKKVLLLFMALGCGNTMATSSPAAKQEILALSYNIKGLPSFASGSYDQERYAEIGEILGRQNKSGRSPDLVLLQESFVPRTVELRDKAGYPFVAQGPGAGAYLTLDSGLYILSRHPILQRASVSFGPDHCQGWDCYASKGVQFARVQPPGWPTPIDVYNTHLQASRNQDAVRLNQVKVLAEFVKKTHNPLNALLFGGDFNFRPSTTPESLKLFRGLTSLLSAAELCFAGPCETRGPKEKLWANSVDHFFVKALTPLALERTFQPVNGRALSDHLGFEGRFRLETAPATSAKTQAPAPTQSAIQNL